MGYLDECTREDAERLFAWTAVCVFLCYWWNEAKLEKREISMSKKMSPLKGPTPPFYAVIEHYGLLGTADVEHDGPIAEMQEAVQLWQKVDGYDLMAFALHRDKGWIMAPWHSKGLRWGEWEECYPEPISRRNKLGAEAMSVKPQAIRNRQIIERDAMNADFDEINKSMRDAFAQNGAEVGLFKLEMNDWLFQRKGALDYYGLVDAVNASIHAATDKATKMAEWRAWATKARLALRYLDAVVDLGHNSVGVGPLELMWNIRSFNERILPAWAEFDALRQGLRVEPEWADVDESGQRFDSPNYVPFGSD